MWYRPLSFPNLGEDEYCDMIANSVKISILPISTAQHNIPIKCKYLDIMSQYSSSPRLGQLKGLYHIFCYPKKHDNSRIVFDPKKTNIDERSFAPGTTDKRDYYVEVMEELPPRVPVALGRSVHNTYFVDSNHAGKMGTRQSHIGLLIYVMNTPIIWLPKK